MRFYYTVASLGSNDPNRIILVLVEIEFEADLKYYKKIDCDVLKNGLLRFSITYFS